MNSKAYDDGYRDAHYGRPFNSDHPYLDAYRRGYNDCLDSGSTFDDPHTVDLINPWGI